MPTTIDSLVVHKVGKAYGSRRILHDVSFTLERGETVALVGENGAGKSTLVGILATLLSPSAGHVLYGNLVEPQDIRGVLGLVAHDSFVYGDLTARENLNFFAALSGVPDAKARSERWLERVGLADEAVATRPVRTFSRGMAQRLSLARALCAEPSVLLLDEAFSGLDRGGVDLLSQLIVEAQKRGTMTVIVSHEFEAIAPLIHRALFLHRGRLAHDAPFVSQTAQALDGLYRTHCPQR